MGKYEIIRVFTSSSLEEILEEGGSGWWKINEAHASKCKYIICIQNNNGPRKSIGKKGTYEKLVRLSKMINLVGS